MVVWHLYLIRCANGALYTGIATDVLRRLSEHRAGPPKGAKFLRGKAPLELVFHHEIGSRSLATKVEQRIKRLKKTDKEGLIQNHAKFDALVQSILSPSDRRETIPPRES